MDLKKVLDSLADIALLPSLVRKGKLQVLLENMSEECVIIFSLQGYRKGKFTLRMGDSKDTDSIARNLKLYLTTDDTTYINNLSTSHQLVILNILRGSVYDNRIVLKYITKLYTIPNLIEALSGLCKTVGAVYFITDDRLHVTVRYSHSKVTSSLKYNIPAVKPNTCKITCKGNLIMTGDTSLYDYFNHYKILDIDTLDIHVPTDVFQESKEFLQELNDSHWDKWLHVVRDTGIHSTQLNGKYVYTTPSDWLLDESYNPIGYHFIIEGRDVQHKCKVPKVILKAGLSSVEAYIQYSITNRSTVRIHTVDIKQMLKEST